MKDEELDYIEGLLHAGVHSVNLGMYKQALEDFIRAKEQIQNIIKMIRSYE